MFCVGYVWCCVMFYVVYVWCFVCVCDVLWVCVMFGVGYVWCGVVCMWDVVNKGKH